MPCFSTTDEWEYVENWAKHVGSGTLDLNPLGIGYRPHVWLEFGCTRAQPQVSMAEPLAQPTKPMAKLQTRLAKPSGTGERTQQQAPTRFVVGRARGSAESHVAKDFLSSNISVHAHMDLLHAQYENVLVGSLN